MCNALVWLNRQVHTDRHTSQNQKLKKQIDQEMSQVKKWHVFQWYNSHRRPTLHHHRDYRQIITVTPQCQRTLLGTLPPQITSLVRSHSHPVLLSCEETAMSAAPSDASVRQSVRLWRHWLYLGSLLYGKSNTEK